MINPYQLAVLISKFKRFAVLLSGNGSNLQAIIDSGLAPYISIVISNVPDAYGLTRALQANLPIKVIDHNDYLSRELFDQQLVQAIDNSGADLLVLAGFMRILTAEFIHHYQGRIINIHPSLLPKYKGLHTHRRALEANDKQHGITIHYVVDELDSGTIIKQSAFDIPQGCDEKTLKQLAHQHEHQLYPNVIKSLLDINQ